MRFAPDAQIAQYAKTHQLTLLTADFDFADIRVYPPGDYFGIAVIDRPENATIAQVNALIERLIDDPQTLGLLPGRLAIVDTRRIRLRPAAP